MQAVAVTSWSQFSCLMHNDERMCLRLGEQCKCITMMCTYNTAAQPHQSAHTQHPPHIYTLTSLYKHNNH
eukprot:17621-Heterococcus_DN1.PRE.3